MEGEAVIGDLVYVIPLDDGTGSWVLMNDEYEQVQICEIPKTAAVAEEVEEPVSKAPAAVGAAGLGLMLLAGLL